MAAAQFRQGIWWQCNPYNSQPATIPAHAMTQSVIRKPGAAPGQQILAIDLTIAPNSLTKLTQLGYSPEIRQVQYNDGVHTMAVLRDELDTTKDLEPEWAALCDRFPPDAVHLWRGKP